jgi:CPA2 family monovalent cation:H+ antiporter-2
VILAAASSEAATIFLEIGAVALVLAVLARLAGRAGLTAIPLYLVAGLFLGRGGFLPLDVSENFIQIVAEIGVLLLLLTLGLEYSAGELRHGLRTSALDGVIDAIANFLPGFGAGLVLGWDVPAAVLLGGVTWVSSSGIISKVLADLDRVGNRETPTILNLLVIEDLAMAVFLPVASAVAIGRSFGATAATIAVALTTVAVILVLALRLGERLSELLHRGDDEPLLLAVFGLTLVVGGLAQRLEVSAAIGAFLVGLALSGPVQHRASTLIAPLRDLFAAVFFVFFGLATNPADMPQVLLPAFGLAVVTMGMKVLTGWFAAKRAGIAVPGRLRAGLALMPRGEFSVVIAGLAVASGVEPGLAPLATAYVLITVVTGPALARLPDYPWFKAFVRRRTTPPWLPEAGAAEHG